MVICCWVRCGQLRSSSRSSGGTRRRSRSSGRARKPAVAVASEVHAAEMCLVNRQATSAAQMFARSSPGVCTRPRQRPVHKVAAFGPVVGHRRPHAGFGIMVAVRQGNRWSGWGCRTPRRPRRRSPR